MGVLYKENEGSDLRVNLIERERWRGVGCRERKSERGEERREKESDGIGLN